MIKGKKRSFRVILTVCLMLNFFNFAILKAEDKNPTSENELKTKTETLKPKHGIWSKRLVLPLGVVSSAAMIIMIVLFLFSPVQKTSDTLISEIYTEFEIKDKNINIIFVQRKDFNLFMEEEHE